MAVDTPATIAVLGAGPVGLEAALYARYLGYDVLVVERGTVAANVLTWGHLRMFSPFVQLRSSLGLAALKAQEPAYRPPETDARLTGKQWVDKYLHPLAQTDLLTDHLRCHTRVISVGRRRLRKHESGQRDERREDGFRMLLEHRDGGQSVETADIVIDATGVHGHPNWCGAGGIPARGELRIHNRIERGVPDILGADRPHYEHCDVLVIGNGLSAAATILALAKLIDRVADTQVTWITHQSMASAENGPIPVSKLDLLPERQRLAAAANELAHGAHPRLNFRPCTAIEAMDYDAASDQFQVRFDNVSEPERFDRIIANVGYRPDRSLYEELRISESDITGGPIGLAATLVNHDAAGTLATERLSVDRLVTTEPNFYVLGAKSYGRDPRFLMSIGFRQIRDLFSIIGGRHDLDLYASAERLAK